MTFLFPCAGREGAAVRPGDGSDSVIRDIALGNFAQDLKPDGETFTQPPNMEIALLANEHCPGGSTQLGVVILKTEDPEKGNFNATPVSVHRVVEEAPDRVAFAAGDTQGRSLLLGPPQIVRVNQHHQPDLILGAPPMHVDFITPAGAAAPAVFNMSAVPDAFNSAYDTMDKTRRVGSERDNGRVKIKGKFAFGGMLDLRTARVTIQSLLNEAGVELVPGAEGVQLTPKQGAQERKAVFETPGGEEPRVRVKLAVRGDMRLVARVRRATIAAPVGCSGMPMTTELALRLVVEDGQNEPVVIETVQPWECKTRRDGTVKTLRLRGVP